MAFSPVTGQPVQYSTEDNELASGYYLKLYNANTTVPYSMAVDATGVDRLAKAKLNDEGYPISNPLDNETVFVPHTDQDYRMVLYRNETDADNNTTANAAWNVDSLRPDASDTQEAANITLRDTTLLAQDDYDRSPLFTDGNGFTAGLGPHVITVPVQVPAWTPNDGIMRFYRLEDDGTITSLTPDSTDATTFTLAETLLSTDTIYIGDDNFRSSSPTIYYGRAMAGQSGGGTVTVTEDTQTPIPWNDIIEQDLIFFDGGTASTGQIKVPEGITKMRVSFMNQYQNSTGSGGSVGNLARISLSVRKNGNYIGSFGGGYFTAESLASWDNSGSQNVILPTARRLQVVSAWIDVTSSDYITTSMLSEISITETAQARYYLTDTDIGLSTRPNTNWVFVEAMK